MGGAKQHVDDWQVHGKVAVDGFAFRWTATGGKMTLDATLSSAYDVSADGEVAVGYLQTLAGIEAFPAPDLSFLTGRPVPALPHRFALLVPGASPHRPGKRWPAGHFGALAAEIVGRGIVPVVVGGPAEAGLAAEIVTACPSAVNLVGGTALLDLFAIAARAEFVVGNDTGPTHIAAAAGCPAVVLFSHHSDPAMTAPRGPGGAWPTVLRVPVLADLTVARVAAALP